MLDPTGIVALLNHEVVHQRIHRESGRILADGAMESCPSEKELSIFP